MSLLRSQVAAALFSASVVLSSAMPALAQGDAAKLEQATKLYEEATKLLDEKRFAEACPKLEQAVALVPVASGAQLALGACYEGQGKLGSAHRRYGEAAALARAAGQGEREQRARDALAALTPRIARFTLQVGPNAKGATGLVVQIDGTEVAPSTWATPQPIDAGAHVLHVEAPGFAPLDQQISFTDGESRAIDFDLTKAQTPPPAPIAPRVDPPTTGDGGSSLQTLGLVLGGVGVAGLVVGGVTGILAIGKKSDGDVECTDGDPPRCPQTSIDARDEGFTFATVSTIGFIAGGALVAGGVVLFVVGGDDDDGEASSAYLEMEARPGGLVVSGAF